MKAVTDPLSKQLELLLNMMKDLRQSCRAHYEENSGLTQGSSRSSNTRSDKIFVIVRKNCETVSSGTSPVKGANLRFDGFICPLHLSAFFVFVKEVRA